MTTWILFGAAFFFAYAFFAMSYQWAKAEERVAKYAGMWLESQRNATIRIESLLERVIELEGELKQLEEGGERDG